MAFRITLALAASLSAPGAAASAPVNVYDNAQVWTGSGFAPRMLAVQDGRFVDPSRAGANAVRVDLAGRYVVPAFANAHAHVTPATPEASRFYASAGVFYVLNPNSVVVGNAARAFWARRDAYDVKVAQGGITEPGGHPEALYVDVLARFAYKGRPREWFVGNAFHYGRDTREIDAALDKLTAQKADFVKAYLLDSANYAANRRRNGYGGGRGMNPALLPYLVAEARKRGLAVAVHVETAHDLRVAAAGGAWMAAHLPGYNGADSAREATAKRLTAADAALVARSGMLVVPTFTVLIGDPALGWDPPQPPPTKRALALQALNLRLLQAAGARIVIGTDGSGPIAGEVEHLVRIGALSAPQAVAAALGTGSRIFPERRIGCFEAGCEADFLVLGADPTRDIRALGQILRRVMAGREVLPPAR